MAKYQLYSNKEPIYVPNYITNIADTLFAKVANVVKDKNLETLRYIPHWRVKKFRAQRLMVYMLEIQQAIVIFPWWRPNFLVPLCVKCGGLTYPVHEAFEDKNAFYMCYNDKCDFIMHTNYK